MAYCFRLYLGFRTLYFVFQTCSLFGHWTLVIRHYSSVSVCLHFQSHPQCFQNNYDIQDGITALEIVKVIF